MVSNKKCKGKFYDGFYVVVKIDKRYPRLKDVDAREVCKLMWRSDTELLLKVPAWDFDLLHSRDEAAAKHKDPSTLWPEHLLHSIDTAHDAMDDSRKFMHLLLKFRSPVVLKADCIHEMDEDSNEIPPDGRMVWSSGVNHVRWAIARTDTEASKRGKTETKKEKGKVASLFDDSPDKTMKGEDEY